MLPVQSVLPATKRTTKKQLKARKKLEELTTKEELTTRDAYRMAQLMQDAAETPEIKEKRKSLQLQSWDSTVRITRDSLTLLRDTNYWKKIRIEQHKLMLPRYEYLENLYLGFHDIFRLPEKEGWKTRP